MAGLAAADPNGDGRRFDLYSHPDAIGRTHTAAVGSSAGIAAYGITHIVAYGHPGPNPSPNLYAQTYLQTQSDLCQTYQDA